MKREAGLLALSAWVVSTLPLFGFSSDGSVLTKSYDRTLALTNSPIVVTVAFTNAGTNPLRGFFYSEEIRSGLIPETLSVRVNGQGVTNATLEAGQDGDVYAGFTPWRWRLETPTNFTEAHPLSEQARVEIVYTLASATQQSCLCPEFAWVAYSAATTNSVFGCSDATDQQTLYFVTMTNRLALSAEHSSSGTIIWLLGDAGVSYVLEACSDSVSWVPLTTNLCCFSFVDTNSLHLSSRWYRGRLFMGAGTRTK